jgi:hypothetical protein
LLRPFKAQGIRTSVYWYVQSSHPSCCLPFPRSMAAFPVISHFLPVNWIDLQASRSAPTTIIGHSLGPLEGYSAGTARLTGPLRHGKKSHRGMEFMLYACPTLTFSWLRVSCYLRSPAMHLMRQERDSGSRIRASSIHSNSNWLFPSHSQNHN